MKDFYPTVTVEDDRGEQRRVKTCHSLRAYLAMCAGYEQNFKVIIHEEGEIMIDAECDKVPSIIELCLKNPELIGEALEWVCERFDDPSL